MQPFGSAAETEAGRIVPSNSILLVDGGPLGVRIECSCLKQEKTDSGDLSFHPKMEVTICFGIDGKEIEKIIRYGPNGLLRESVWDDSLKDVVRSCGEKLTSRGLNVPPEFLEHLRSELVASRRSALLMAVRAFARHFVSSLPAGDACQIWMEEEARHIINS